MRRFWAAVTGLAVVASAVAIIQPQAALASPTGKEGIGYWLAQGDGTAFPLGDAPNLAGSVHDAAGIVGIAAKPGGGGYVLGGADGGVFTFGAAKFYGSMGGGHINQPIVGIAYTPSGNGYYLVASDGGVFTFGDAHYYGSTGGIRLNSPIVAMAVTPTGDGYWLVAADGGVFSFGDARFHGSAAGMRLSAPIGSIAVTHDGRGYWLAGRDGAVYSFGDAPFFGAQPVSAAEHAVTIAASPTGKGYLIAFKNGSVLGFGDAQSCSAFLDLSSATQRPKSSGTFGSRSKLLPSGETPNTVGLAIPFDAATVRSLLGGSCHGPSNAFHATSPWHIDFGKFTDPPYGTDCGVFLLTGHTDAHGYLPTLDAIQADGTGRLEIRSTQMAGNKTFRLSTGGACYAVARPGTGGTQTLPFKTATAGDTLPFTSTSPITITNASAQPCPVFVFTNSDGHEMDRQTGPHASFTIPAGTYFLQTEANCPVTVS